MNIVFLQSSFLKFNMGMEEKDKAEKKCQMKTPDISYVFMEYGSNTYSHFIK